MRRGERAPSGGRLVVLVDVLQVVDIGHISDGFVCCRIRVAQISQHGVRTLGERLGAELDLRQTDQTDVAHERREEDETDQHARKTKGADRRRECAGLSSRRNQVRRRCFSGGNRRRERVPSRQCSRDSDSRWRAASRITFKTAEDDALDGRIQIGNVG